MAKTWLPQEFAVAMGMDAFRLCIGVPTRNFSRRDVMRWLRLNQRPAASEPEARVEE